MTSVTFTDWYVDWGWYIETPHLQGWFVSYNTEGLSHPSWMMSVRYARKQDAEIGLAYLRSKGLKPEDCHHLEGEEDARLCRDMIAALPW